MHQVIEGDKAIGFSGFDYLIYLLEQLSQPGYEIDQLLPWAFAKR
tara:strand:+ start:432 stop:566 length:135 start_codon:yes stop_codon:yes gene_type:complete